MSAASNHARRSRRQLCAASAPPSGIADALRRWRRARGMTQRRAALTLHVGAALIPAWERSRRYPPQRYWPRLVAAGIATRAQLQQWRPAPDPGDQLERALTDLRRAAARTRRRLPRSHWAAPIADACDRITALLGSTRR